MSKKVSINYFCDCCKKDITFHNYYNFKLPAKKVDYSYDDLYRRHGKEYYSNIIEEVYLCEECSNKLREAIENNFGVFLKWENQDLDFSKSIV